MQTYSNFVANRFIDDSTAQTFAVLNPATAAPFATVQLASPTIAEQAVQCAVQALGPWKRLPAIERARALQRLADALVRHAPTIGAALAQESGKSLQDACAEVGYGAEIVRYHAEWARRIEGEIIPSDNPREQLFLHREAIGVVVCLIPFNFPIYTLLRKIAPALITGNTVVVRPSNSTPVSALVLAQAVREAELPEGVVTVSYTHLTLPTNREV